MTSRKNTKRALLASILSVVLCVSMLIGTTFAWFTDSVTNTGNKIVSGNLKVDLIHVGGGDNGEDVSLKNTPDHKIFDYDKWEPGYTAMETLRVVNEGNLAVKFRLDATTEGAVDGKNGEKLADVIDVYVYEGDGIPTITSFEELKADSNWRNAGSLSSLMADPDGVAHGVLLPDGENKDGLPSGSVQMTVALHMQESADNDYQSLSLGSLNFILNATQYTYEEDGFGSSDYDTDAAFADTYVTSSAELKDAIANAEDGDVIGLTAATYEDDITINKDITLVGSPDTIFTGEISATPKTTRSSDNYPALTVEGATFADTASIDEGNMKAITLKNCKIEVGTDAFINSTNESNGYRSIQYTLIGNTFTSVVDNSVNFYPIMTYGSFADGSVISGNVFGSESNTICSFAFRPMNVDDGATITVSNNVVYSLGNYAFAFYNNADRAADYTVIFENNETHVTIPKSPDKGFLWIESRVNRNDIHAKIVLKGENTYNDKPVTADNIYSGAMSIEVVNE